MNELQRHRYLSALGIDSFVPRVILPWAPAPQACPLPELQEQRPASAVAQNASPQTVAPMPAPSEARPARTKPQAAGAVGDVLRDLGVAAPAKPAGTHKPVLSLLKSRPEREAIEPVHLQIWRPQENLWVIDQHTPGSALPTHRLLQNILLAYKGGAARVDTGERVRFPIDEHLAQMYGPDDLRHDLQSWFAEEYHKNPAAELWLMGEQASRYFLSEQDESTKPYYRKMPLTAGEHVLPAGACAWVFPSLTQLLYQPTDKAKLWQALNAHR